MSCGTRNGCNCGSVLRSAPLAAPGSHHCQLWAALGGGNKSIPGGIIKASPGAQPAAWDREER